MDIKKLLSDYAKAWVKLHARAIDGWSEAEIFDAYYLLPSPQIGFQEWCEARGYTPQGADASLSHPDAMGESPEIMSGPGWAIAKGERGKEIMEAQIKNLELLSERMKPKAKAKSKA